MCAEFAPDGPATTLADLFGETTGTVYLTNASADDVETVVTAAGEYDGELPHLRVLGVGEELRKVRRNFLVASRAADLVDTGVLELHERKPSHNTTLLAAPEAVYVPIHIDTVDGTAVTRHEAFREDVYDWCERNWEITEPFDLRTPPLSLVRETLDGEFDPAAREDFDQVLDSTVDVRDTGDLDEVMASLLVAAKHELLHYNLSKWGEDIGLASKATFSRKKGKLEEMGVLTTEKVAVDMGRPRQRLVFTEEYRDEVQRDGLSNLITNVVY